MHHRLLTPISYTHAPCSLGIVLVAQSHSGICAIFLGDGPDKLVKALHKTFPKATQKEIPEIQQVITIIENPKTTQALALDIQGTAFQKKVWRALQEIPAGSTASYTDIADKIGSPTSCRAVAQACAANQLAVIIPCHRVVRKDGGLSGYRWGVERKRILLEKEKECGGSSEIRTRDQRIKSPLLYQLS